MAAVTERKLLPRWALVALAIATLVAIGNAVTADDWDERVFLIPCAAVMGVFLAVQTVRHVREQPDHRTER